MDLLPKAIELFANNKEFGALIGILIYSMKTHNAAKVQQATCNGKFEKQELINTNTEKKTEKAVQTSEKAEETAEKAFSCVREVKKNVDTLIDTVDDAKKEFREKYKQYTDGKHTESLTKE